MYTDYSYYTGEYLANSRDPTVSEDAFRYWEKQAGQEINKYTYGTLKVHPERICDEVKECACELAEFLYQADSVSQQALERGGAGLLASYSNDGESGTFDLSRSAFTEEGKIKKIREIIYKHLSYTGLLYAGVRA